MSYLYLAETHINRSDLWSDVSIEIDIIALFLFAFGIVLTKMVKMHQVYFLWEKNGPTDGYKKAQLEADWILSDSP